MTASRFLLCVRGRVSFDHDMARRFTRLDWRDHMSRCPRTIWIEETIA